jgi:threonine/homoserine/homoserine lactone efflux protein
VTLAQYLAFVVFITVASVTPGPNNTMLMASGANFGLRRTVPHMVGVVLGFGVLVTSVGLGLGALFALWPVLHTILRWVGAAYLFWLAWKIATADSIGGQVVARPLRFWEVVAFQWVNPKAWIGAVGAIAAYAPQTHYLAGLALIVGTTALVNIPVVLMWAGAGVAVRRFLDHPRRLRAFNIIMGLALALSVIPMLSPNGA